VKLGDWLLGKGRITPEQLSRALQDQTFFGGRLGHSLIKLGYIPEDALGEYLSDMSGIRYAPAQRLDGIPPEVLATVPARLAGQYRIIPISIEGRRLHLAMRDPKDLIALDEIAFLTGLAIEPYVATEFRIVRALERYYQITVGPKTIPVTPGPPEIKSPLPPRTAARAPAPEMGLDGFPLDADPSDLDQPFLGSRGGARPAPRGPEEPLPASLEEWRMAREEIPERLPEVVPPKAASQAQARPASPPPPPPAAEPAVSTQRVAALRAVPAPAAAAPHSMAALSERLRAAETRDEIFDAILDYTAARFRRCALFVVQQDRVLGWSGRGEGISGGRIRNVSVPLTRPSLFVFFRDGGHYYYGPVPDLPANARFYLDMGCPPPARVLLMPLMIKDRPSVVLYADNGADGSGAPEIGQFRRALRKAGLALEILILKNKIMML
jgi:hypothetical protein